MRSSTGSAPTIPAYASKAAAAEAGAAHPVSSRGRTRAWHRAHPPPRTRRPGREPRPVRLAAVDPGSRYRDRESGRELDGVLLREYGLPLELPSGDYASALTVLDRVADAAPN